MKTNEWLALFLQENRATFAEVITTATGIAADDERIGTLISALESDFDGEVIENAPPALLALTANDGSQALALWQKIDAKLSDYVAGEAEITGGARRLAYLRVSDYANQLRGILSSQ